MLGLCLTTFHCNIYTILGQLTVVDKTRLNSIIIYIEVDVFLK